MEGKRKRKLSVAIITFNEEKNIGDCIRSVVSFADEIIVLDSLSTDKTKEIATSFPKVRFLEAPFPGHVEQKNKAISFCQNEWIFSLDADERADEVLQNSIQTFLETDEVHCDGYKIARLTFHLGRWIRYSGWYPQRRYRLFKKENASWIGENPHDFIELKPGSFGKVMKGNILHYSFTDFSHQITTINQFSSIVAYTRYAKGERFSLVKTIIKPLGKFFEIYLFKFGFLDGIPGLWIALASSFSTYLKYAKLYELDQLKIQRPSNIRKDYGKK
ncbi:glycosyltransferase family 2 protein [Leptospira biflexa]|jgi:glycosyltransferase involved in cell wall biosynthesis|uniref:glycosyltransferase family 2 protein n=1 Tax=Leptospira biflexa TaxID=172 RepID=UPI001083E9A1|nr:glycosyltransferase family 2 protein [Leptospira biflexa]TGM34389.1 glycosyltransferase family 2 protein [Leptospira biflexa]TGM39957.1 glycosyltransferase family 2 protein [Leptospira biflexa]TGM48450.1 glycosyltransferase family 2 protein [Leptospira biflexa]TGM49084.1 glycosyltransferase family 2 protein [Leptospira biflexa]